MNGFSIKWYIPLILLCLSVLFGHPGAVSECFAQQHRFSSENSADGPSIVLAEKTFDFGEVDEGSVVSHEFTVKNEGGTELQIKKVSPD